VAVWNSLNPVLDKTVRSELLDTVAWLAPERSLLFERHGMRLEFSGCDAISPWLTIAFATEEFLRHKVNGVRMVGPSIPPGPRGDERNFEWGQLRKDVPIIYLSFGSQLYYQPDLFWRMIEASATLGVQLVIAAQQLHGTKALDMVPGHVLTCG